MIYMGFFLIWPGLEAALNVIHIFGNDVVVNPACHALAGPSVMGEAAAEAAGCKCQFSQPASRRVVNPERPVVNANFHNQQVEGL